ncbi:MAG: tail fiber domain-containing protein [Xanthomonadales bacterium]|nr:tail fiber domain-containing protein [Xanthomonadales bacterium]
MKRSMLSMALIIAAAPALAIDSSLTYQGSLEDGGQPANGSYDLQFTLQDSGGATIGSVLLRDDVSVAGGVFTVELDFGSTAFTGPDRFLQIGVRAGTSTGAFTALSPRSKVTPTPYAQVAEDALFAASVADNSITSAKVAADALNASDLATGSVGTDEVANGSLRGEDIDDGSLTGAKIVDGTIATNDLSNNAVTSAKIADETIAAADIGPAAVGSSEINSSQVQARIAGTCAAGNAIRTVAADGSVSCEATGGSSGWSLSGNSLAGNEFLGSSNSAQLQFRVNNQQVALYTNDAISPNVLHGKSGNATTAGVRGAVVAGGGTSSDPGLDLNGVNVVLDAYGVIGGGVANQAGTGAQAYDQPFPTIAGGQGNHALGAWSVVGGGRENFASGDSSTVAGGIDNRASGPSGAVGGGSGNVAAGSHSVIGGGGNNCAGGSYSWAGGFGAKVRPGTDFPSSSGGCAGVQNSFTPAGDSGTFVWNDAAAPGLTSSGPNQFLVRAQGGMALNFPPPDASVELTMTSDADNADFSSLWLRLRSTFNPGILISAGDASGSNGAGFYIDHYNGSTQTRRMALNNDGSAYIRSNLTGANTGVSLAANSGSWSSLSDRNLKTAINAVDPVAVLRTMVDLPISTWSYTAQGEGVRHMGPMAQDFAASFGLGEDDTHINTVDIDGVALAAIQGLHTRLQDENTALRERVDKLERRLAALERAQVR